jgi:tellurite resistance protein TerC
MIWLWIGFFVLIIALLALDLGVFHRRSHAIGVREAMGWTLFWIALGLAFCGPVYLIYEHHWFGAAVAPGGDLVSDGAQAVVRYLTAYLLEKSLSVDNIFVISMLFSSFRVPARHQHRVLFWGIVGALVARGAMIGGGIWLVTRFTWIFYVFGAYLGYAGVKLLLARHEEGEARPSRLGRVIRRVLPVARGDHGGRFTTRVRGRFAFTELMLALIAVELTDVVFALDSIPAVLAITAEPFIVVTSNVFAILGLRALYFVLAEMISRFRYLKLALAGLLIYIGLKMILHSLIKIPNLVSLGVVLGALVLGVVASLAARGPRRRF